VQHDHPHRSGTKTVPERLQTFQAQGVPKSLTLKNLPDGLHAHLAAAAKRNRRGLSSEAIVCLEAGLGDRSSVEDQLAQIYALRQALPSGLLTDAQIDRDKRSGRP
jgi:plasmid stability protein